jgi:putative SOS response-associated peptidase YedK
MMEGWKISRIAGLETANQKPMFHDSFRARHCMVLADSFYEWQTLPSGKKQPYRVMLKTGEPFAIAGIYARSDDHQFGDAENAPITFAILTTSANELMQPITNACRSSSRSAARRTGYRGTPRACSSFPNSPLI